MTVCSRCACVPVVSATLLAEAAPSAGASTLEMTSVFSAGTSVASACSSTASAAPARAARGPEPEPAATARAGMARQVPESMSEAQTVAAVVRLKVFFMGCSFVALASRKAVVVDVPSKLARHKHKS